MKDDLVIFIDAEGPGDRYGHTQFKTHAIIDRQHEGSILSLERALNDALQSLYNLEPKARVRRFAIAREP